MLEYAYCISGLSLPVPSRYAFCALSCNIIAQKVAYIAEMSYDQIKHIQNAKFAKGKIVYENYLQDLSDVSAGYSKFRVIHILCCASYSYGSST